MRGPKPTKNSVTFMPERLATMKWPTSCSMIDQRPAPRIDPTIVDLRRRTRRQRRAARCRPAMTAMPVTAFAARPAANRRADLSRVLTRSSVGDRRPGALARDPVGFENVGDLIGVPGARAGALRRRSRRCPSRGCARRGTPRPRPRSPRSAPRARCHRPGRPRRRGARHRNVSRSGSSKSSVPSVGPVDRAERPRSRRCGRAERQADRQPHVGHRELGDRRAVAELDHRRARSTAGARRRRCGRSRRRTARGPRSPRGPCS